ncbi:hypothetical protein JCM8547_004603 [Rhodosporidiobolus lusitaniae]
MARLSLLPLLALAASNAAAASNSSSRAVFAHVMFGEVQSYTIADHQEDMELAASVGIDAFAINTGHDTFDAQHVANVFQAAKNANFKLFFSFDLLHYNVANASEWILYDYLEPYALTDEYYKIDGKSVISTFGGNQAGQYLNGVSSFDEANEAWNKVFETARNELGIDSYFCPFWLTMPADTPSDALDLDAVGNWFGNGGIGSSDQVTADADKTWREQTNDRGIDYWAPVSAHFSVHQVADRNYVYSGGDFLLPTHYSSLINLNGSAPDYIEFITFSDWGESTYMGPVRNNSSPPSETLDTALYVDGHDHQPFLILSAYYNYWYKAGNGGSPPTITSEAIFWWHRGHPVNLVATNDPLPKPDGAEALTDTIYCVVLVPAGSSASKLVITTGGQAGEGQDVVEGVNLIMADFTTGETGVSLQDADGNELLSGAGQTIVGESEIYDFNYYAFSVPAGVAASDFLDIASSSSSSKVAVSSTATGSVSATQSGMTTSIRASSTSTSSSGSSSKSSSTAESTSSSSAASSSSTWWVGGLVLALLAAAGFLFWRSKKLTDSGQQEPRQGESSDSSRASLGSRRSSVSSSSDSDSDSDSSDSSSSSPRSTHYRSLSHRPVPVRDKPG